MAENATLQKYYMLRTANRLEGLMWYVMRFFDSLNNNHLIYLIQLKQRHFLNKNKWSIKS